MNEEPGTDEEGVWSRTEAEASKSTMHVCVCVCVGVRLNIFIHSQMMLVVMNLPAIERQIQSLGQEDPLEKEMATHSSIFTCKIPWTAEPGGLQSMGSQRVVHTRSD